MRPDPVIYRLTSTQRTDELFSFLLDGLSLLVLVELKGALLFAG